MVVMNVSLPSLRLASLIPAHEQWGEQEAPSLSHRAIDAFQTPRWNWPCWSYSRSRNIHWENQIHELNSLIEKQRSLEPSLKFSSQVNLPPFSDPSACVNACGGFAQRKQGREDVCSGFRAAGCWIRAFIMLFHTVGTMALVPLRLQWDE